MNLSSPVKAARLVNQVQAACPIFGLSVGTVGVPASVSISFDPAATAAQRTAAHNVVNTFDWSDPPDATLVAQQAKAAATASIDNGQLQNGQHFERLIRALALVVMDELNLHTTFESALLAAIAAATTLADLKTRVALITPVPQRTAAQIVPAIKAKIALTAE